VSFVLVHGALIDGSSWRGVYDALTKDGFRVSVAPSPLTGLGDVEAASQRLNDRLDGPVILVGNSDGGSIITVPALSPT
jgi:pimeloyl-ACP methyl ester carboxylesterase